ncbi:MAG: glycine-rich domain-containing protein [Bacteroidota bacterium]
MNRSQWEKIKAFDLDYPHDEYCFSLRLAHKNAWTIEFTQKAIQEYKKFMYLAAISDEMVSPSSIVDIVWHQHLIFTKSYTQFCQLIGKRIEHVPSTHNEEEKSKFEQGKRYTQNLYEENFGVQPKEIWNILEMLDLLGMKKAKMKVRAMIVIGITAFIFLLSPFFFVLKPLYVQIKNPYFIWGYLFLIVGLMLFLWMFNRYKIQRLMKNLKGNALFSDLRIEEIVYLKYRDLAKIIHGHVNKNLDDNALTIVDLRIKPGAKMTERKDQQNLFDKVILELVERFQSTPYPLLYRHLRTKSVFINIAKSMRALEKYILKSKFYFRLFLFNYIALLFTFFLGVERIQIGLAYNKPVGFLLLILFFFALAVIVFLYNLQGKITRNYIPETVVETIKSRKQSEISSWQWDFYILGTMLYYPGFKPLVVSQNSGGMNDGSGGNCGSSCSSGGGSCGSSCGGGCGGCGGN